MMQSKKLRLIEGYVQHRYENKVKRLIHYLFCSQIETSISLPCTLRRCKNPDSLNFQHLTKKAEKLEALGAARLKSSSPTNASILENDMVVHENYGSDAATNSDLDRSCIQPKEDGDSEYLLPNEHNAGVRVAPSLDKYECCVRSRRNSRVNEQPSSNAIATKGNSGWISEAEE